MALRCALLALALACATVTAFVAPAGTIWCRQHAATARCSALSMKWDGKSEPKKNPLLDGLEATASWERENERKEVWEDRPNPEHDWIAAYYPTDEEREAAAAGYDFSNPEAWLERQKAKA